MALLRTIIALSAIVWLQGCGIAPRDGPTTSNITSPGSNESGEPDYVVVELDKNLSGQVKAYHDQLEPLNFTDLPPAHAIGLVGTGDVLTISIWEANTQAGGVFAQGHAAEMTAVVDENGDISVPYAGRFNIAGLSLSKIEAKIVEKLKGKAYTPQVSVQLKENVSNTVFLQGEIGHPGRFPLMPGGNKLLDLIALAGGPKLQPHETTIQVSRDGKIVSTDLFRIMNDASLNIPLAPGDSVIASRRFDMFYAFGAVGHAGQIPFSEHTTTLLQALGEISGLQDARSDPKGVFIFRHEPGNLVSTLAPVPGAVEKPKETVQVVYHINLDDPNSFFVLNSFPVRPSDIIYVSNAPLTNYQKVIDAVVGPGQSIANTALQAAILSKQSGN